MSAWVAAIMAAAAAVAVAVMRCSLAMVTVTGRSMAPSYLPGDRVVVRRRPRRALRVGSVILLPEPGRPGDARPRGPWPARGTAGLRRRSWVIKRVAALPGHVVPSAVRDAVGGVSVVPPGMLVVLGDNIAESADSRLWGFMRADDVLGVVVRSITRPSDWS